MAKLKYIVEFLFFNFSKGLDIFCFFRDSLSFKTMMDVETAIDEEKTALQQSKNVLNDNKSADRASENLKKMSAVSLGYKYYLGMDTLKHENLFKSKYLKAVHFESQLNPATPKSPVVKGPRVSQIKNLFESMSNPVIDIKSRLSMPSANLRSKVSKKIKPYFKNTTFHARESFKLNKAKTAPSVKNNGSDFHQTPEKKNTPEFDAIKDQRFEKKTSMIYRQYILKNNPSPLDRAGISRSPIRPVHQTRKIFSPKASPRKLQ